MGFSWAMLVSGRVFLGPTLKDVYIILSFSNTFHLDVPGNRNCERNVVFQRASSVKKTFVKHVKHQELGKIEKGTSSRRARRVLLFHMVDFYYCTVGSGSGLNVGRIFFFKSTLPKFNIAPQKLPSQ